MPGTAKNYSNIGITVDILSWGSNAYTASVVTYGGIVGAGIGLPFTEGGPEVPALTGAAGAGIAELYIQLLLSFSTVLSSVGTAATVISDTKAGSTRIEQGKISSSVMNSFSLTVLGAGNKEAYIGLIFQSVSVANDFGWTLLPWSR